MLAVPPGVVIAIFPVFAPTGTVAVTCVAELTVNEVAFAPPKLTVLVWVRPVPVITTWLPTAPLLGLKAVMAGRTLKLLLLTRSPDGVVTTTGPLVPVAGTVAVM